MQLLQSRSSSVNKKKKKKRQKRSNASCQNLSYPRMAPLNRYHFAGKQLYPELHYPIIGGGPRVRIFLFSSLRGRKLPLKKSIVYDPLVCVRASVSFPLLWIFLQFSKKLQTPSRKSISRARINHQHRSNSYSTKYNIRWLVANGEMSQSLRKGIP